MSPFETPRYLFCFIYFHLILFFIVFCSVLFCFVCFVLFCFVLFIYLLFFRPTSADHWPPHPLPPLCQVLLSASHMAPSEPCFDSFPGQRWESDEDAPLVRRTFKRGRPKPAAEPAACRPRRITWALSLLHLPCSSSSPPPAPLLAKIAE